MVPDRIVQDAKALNKYVLSAAISQKCFNIDPCDIYTSKYCCPPGSKNPLLDYVVEEEKKRQDKNSKPIPANKTISGVEFFLFFLVIAIILAILLIVFIVFI
jgi:hypothetical protein